MKLSKIFAILSASAIVFGAQGARAETGEIEKQEPQLETESKKSDYEARLKQKYNLTDAELTKLHSQGMNDTQITIAAQLAKDSGKSIDDIVKMRLDQKKGWGEIAKELGLPPKEIGQSIADMHRHNHDKKHDHDDDKKHDREDAKERAERRNDRKERHEERAERKAGKSGHGRD